MRSTNLGRFQLTTLVFNRNLLPADRESGENGNIVWAEGEEYKEKTDYLA
jgi:hypothetical protein